MEDLNASPPASPAPHPPHGSTAPTAPPPAPPTRLVARTTRLDLPGSASDPDALLDLLPARAPLSWVRRGDGLIGWGEAARIEVGGEGRFAHAESSWRHLLERTTVHDDVRAPGTGPVAFGSFAFDAASPSGGVLVVPSVVVGRRGRLAWVTTIAPEPDGPVEPPSVADLLVVGAAPVRAPGEVTYTDGALTRDAWADVVSRAVEHIRAGEVDKVVLARDVHARTQEVLDPRWLLERLAAEYAGCWTFCVDGLVGATPELLVRSERGLVISRVLAGTVRRTGSEQDDLAHAAALTRSSKDLEEHEYAVDSVARALEPFCASTNVPETPFVLQLPNVMHLATDVTGVLAHPGASSLDLVEALHPTAAVCGTPTEAANRLIQEIEGLDRGRYAGPVGWIGADGDGEWGIGLRSAELAPDDPHDLRLFAGCGIVAASVPQDELAETDAKLEPMRYALGG